MFKKKLFDLFFEIVMILMSLIIIIPLLIMLLGSLKTAAEASLFNIALPTEWKFDNYSFVIDRGGILRAMINSIVVTIGTLVFSIVPAAFCGFVIARKKTRYTRFLENVFLAGMIAPIQIITTFALLKVLRLIGTPFAVMMIFTAIQLPWCIFMFFNFIKGTPRELDEAAFIDGSGPMRMFFTVIFPILKPIVATTTVMTAMFAWNDFMIPLYFFNNSKNWTMPLTVYNFFGQYFSNWNYVFADLVLTAIPVTILYLYCQKYIIAGLTSGAVKG